MKPKVFIVWGGKQNHKLAQRVATELGHSDFAPVVGGDDVDPLSDDGYLGKRIINEMNQASRAIVLAQPERNTGHALRPNLVFEWGYLASRLRASYLHVYLMGLSHKDLPTDLLGRWAPRVAARGIGERAGEIAAAFAREVNQSIPNGTDVFMHWHDDYRSWLEYQAKSKSAPDPHCFAAVLLHSIQPAYYGGELDVLERATQSLGSDSTKELCHVRALVYSARSYYDITDNPIEFQSAATLDKVRNALAVRPSWINLTNSTHSWMEVLRLDFHGLSLKSLGLSESSRTVRDSRLREALKSFKLAVQVLRKLKADDDYAIHLWNGYILRNMGTTEAHLNSPRAATTLRSALEAHQRASGYLSAPLPRDTAAEYALETILLELQLAFLRKGDKEGAQRAAANAMRVLLDRSVARRATLWRRAQRLLEDLVHARRLEQLPESLRSRPYGAATKTSKIDKRAG